MELLRESVRIRSFSGPYSVRMRENTDQKNSEYGHFLHSAQNFCKNFQMVKNHGDLYKQAMETCVSPE